MRSAGPAEIPMTYSTIYFVFVAGSCRNIKQPLVLYCPLWRYFFSVTTNFDLTLTFPDDLGSAKMKQYAKCLGQTWF